MDMRAMVPCHEGAAATGPSDAAGSPHGHLLGAARWRIEGRWPTANRPGFPGREVRWKTARFRAEQLRLIRLLELAAPLLQVGLGDGEGRVRRICETMFNPSPLFLRVYRQVDQLTLSAGLAC